MGAFFSGTDDNDDRNFNSYSGVIGKLNEPTPATVWRLNVGPVKINAKFEDIFEVPFEARLPVPEEWLEKVQVRSFPEAGRSGPYGQFQPKDQLPLLPGKSDPVANAGSDEYEPYNNDWYHRGASASDLSRKQVNHLEGLVDSMRDWKIDEADPYKGSGASDYLTIQYGEEIATSYEAVMDNISALEGCDDLLEDALNEIVSVLSDAGKSKLMTNGLH
jgi:hypothetical protein